MALGKFYNDWIEAILPSWLKGTWGLAWWHVVGAIADDVHEGVREAITSRYPQYAPDDALPLIGSDRMMPQYPRESLAAYRRRLVGAWDAWSQAGTAAAIVSQMNAFGLPNVGAYGASGGECQLDGDATRWSRFAVFVRQPMAYSRGHTYGDGGLYGLTTWGSTLTVADVKTMRRLIRQWKPAHAVGYKIYFIFAGPVWDPGKTWTSGGVYGPGADVLAIPLTKFWADSTTPWGAGFWGGILD